MKQNGLESKLNSNVPSEHKDFKINYWTLAGVLGAGLVASAVATVAMLFGMYYSMIALPYKMTMLKTMKEDYEAETIPLKPNFFNYRRVYKACYYENEIEENGVTITEIRKKEFSHSKNDAEKKYAMIGKRYVAAMVRNGGSFMCLNRYGKRDGVGHIDKEITEIISQLYGNTARTIKTEKGEWKIYERKNVEENKEKRFCAVYMRDNKPRTMFIGDLKHKKAIEPTAKEISEKILELNKFAWPPRNLTERDGFTYGLEKSLYLPLIMMADTIYGFSNHLAYKPVMVNGLEWALKQGENAGPAIIMGSVVGALAGIVQIGNAFKVLGKAADIKRGEGLPDEAGHFSYGEFAISNIKKEFIEANVSLTDKALMAYCHKKGCYF